MNYRIHRESLYRLLGLPDRIPSDQSGRWEGIMLPSDRIIFPCSDWSDSDQRESLPGLWTVVLTESKGGYAKHRLYVECRCGRLIPTGRLAQHRKACSL